LKENQDQFAEESINQSTSSPRNADRPNPDQQADRPAEIDDGDDFEFEVREASSDAPNFLPTSDKSSDQGGLGVQSTADLMDDQARYDDAPEAEISLGDNSPIGDSAPPPPPAAYQDYPSQPGLTPTGGSPAEEPVAEPATPTNGVKKLSAEEVKSINANLYASSPYLTDEEKQELVSSIDETQRPFGNTPIDPSKRAPQPAPTREAVYMAPAPVNSPEEAAEKPAAPVRQRGICFYYKNFIQIKSTQRLKEYDQLKVNDREYVLRPKRLSTKTLIAITAPVFVLLLFVIGAQFISDASGEGRVVGMVMGDDGRPYVQQATIRFPDLDKVFKSDAQGFFRTDPLPSGSHRVEYVLAGVTIGIDHATVVGGEVTTLTLRATPEKLAEEESASAASRNEVASVSAPAPSPAKPAPKEKSTPPSSAKESTTKSKKSTSSKASYAKVTLDANVDGAALAIDGDVLGAGNLTYSRIKPGEHTYTVSKDGFESVSGKVTLRADKNRNIKVSLTPLSQNAKAQVYSGDDFFHSGVSLLRDGKYQTAAADLTEAIKSKPAFAEAFYARAQANQQLGKKQAAFDDYLRAAEIFQMHREYGQAINGYQKCVDLDQKAIIPLLGRGNMYLAKGEEIAAIADFERVLDINDDDFQANFGLGKARYEQGYYKKAVKHLKKAHKIDRQSPEVFEYLMLSYMGANDLKNVKKAYEKYAEIASAEQMRVLREDNRFLAVRKVIELDS